MKIIVAQDCNCSKPIANFTDQKKALKAYIDCLQYDEANGHMYWAIHFNGKHVLSIEEDDSGD